MLQLSVIIPTFCRKATLIKGLESLNLQQGIDQRDVEIVVADDGSTDGTAEAVRCWSATSQMRILFSPSAENRGPAHARNRAVSIASGRILLIMGDDILPASDLLVRHMHWHEANPAEEDALLGRVMWPRNPPPTPFMHWLASDGRTYFLNYPEVSGPVAANRFYTCNVSLKKALMVRGGGFDEAFSRASHEDIELGLRLSRQCGMHLYYDPDSVGYHDHRLSFPSAFRRIYFMGYSSVMFWSTVGEGGSVTRRALRRVMRAVGSLRLLRRIVIPLVGRIETFIWPPVWRAFLSAAYWFGSADAVLGRPALPPGDGSECPSLVK
jgi:glycosyltransferase involved in cell wall biosynthesis